MSDFFRYIIRRKFSASKEHAFKRVCILKKRGHITPTMAALTTGSVGVKHAASTRQVT